MNIWRTLLLVVFVAGPAAGCVSHVVQVEPVQVEPIHMTVDVNVQVEGEVDAVLEPREGEQGDSWHGADDDAPAGLPPR